MPACCGLLTMGFGVFKCKIEVITPPSGGGGGGGGYYPHPGFYVPYNRPVTDTTKIIVVTVKLKKQTWSKSYVVDEERAAITIKIINLLNSTRKYLQIGADAISVLRRKVTAAFTRSE